MLKKYKLITVVVCIIQLLFLTTFSACSLSINRIRFVDELIIDKVFDEDDLKNIAAIRNGSLQIVADRNNGTLELQTVEYTPTPVNNQLSKKQEQKLLSDFKKYVHHRYHSANFFCFVTSSKIVNYYGTYAGYAVVEVYLTLSGQEPSDDESDLIIFDYYLGKINDNSKIVCWKTGD